MPTVEAAISLLPPNVQASLADLSTQVSKAMPLVGLAQMAANGQTVSEGQALGGMVALASMINPIAGAALGAAGTMVMGAEQGLKDIFTALGWIDAPVPMRPASIKPWGPDDPIWWHTSSIVALKHPPEAEVGGYTGANQGNFDAYNLLMNTLQALKTPGYIPSLPTPWPLNDFERFFYPILVADLERWINGAAFIKPRELLMASVNAWNKMRGPATSVTYAQTPAGQGTHDLTTKVVSQILGPGGDLVWPTTPHPPISVNMGQPAAAAVTPKKVVGLHFGGMNLGSYDPRGSAPVPGAPIATANTPIAAISAPPLILPHVAAQKTIVVLTPPSKSLADRVLPFAPAAMGAVLFPVAGVVAPVLGAAASAAWLILSKKT